LHFVESGRGPKKNGKGKRLTQTGENKGVGSDGGRVAREREKILYGLPIIGVFESGDGGGSGETTKTNARGKGAGIWQNLESVQRPNGGGWGRLAQTEGPSPMKFTGGVS